MSSPITSAQAIRVTQRLVPELPVVLHENPLVHRLLAARGLTQPDQLKLALAGLPLPDTLPAIQLAVRRLIAARERSEKIVIIGDYDCDGATSTAVAMLGLQMLGFAHLDYLIPNRFKHGYGLSPAIVESARHEYKPALIVTVDNGVASVDGVALAAEYGIDVLVTDHHLPPVQLPEAVAIVNPNLDDSNFPGTALAGVGVIFYTLLAVRRKLAMMGDSHAKAPLAELLDLVAIGTVADLVPLDAINRVLVEQGLRRIRSGHTRPGIQALLRESGRSHEALTTQDIGFGLGPRLNAAGRLDDMRVGVQCLLSETDSQASSLASSLNTLNQQRRSIEQDMQHTANEQLDATELEKRVSADACSVCLFDQNWHQGVIGILAGRIKELLYRPVVIFTRDEDDLTLKGSARSIPGVHIRDVLESIANEYPGMVEKFGGHAMAAGLTLKKSSFDQFREAFEEQVSHVTQGSVAAREFLSDGSLKVSERTLDNARLLATIMPWGQGFEAPLFADRFKVLQHRIVGRGHLKLLLESWDEPGSPAVDGIAFNCTVQPVTEQPMLAVYSLEINTWRDRQSVQLRVHHLEPAALR